MRLLSCFVVTGSQNLFPVLLVVVLVYPTCSVTFQHLSTGNFLPELDHNNQQETTTRDFRSTTTHHDTAQDNRLRQTPKETHPQRNESTTVSGNHLQQEELSTVSQQGRAFPYNFKRIALAAERNPTVKLGMPYMIKESQPELQAHVAQDRVGLHEVALEAGNLIMPSRDDSEHNPGHHLTRPLSRPLSKTELDFLGIIAAILLKLVVSTALASWFLAAGQVLYGVATLTGSTAVFGMDSAIRYVYKTLPFIEALLEGETTFS